MSARGMGRRAGGVSIVGVLVATSVLVLGAGLAWADTVAMLVQTVDASAWTPASNDPSGAAYISGAGYLFVVDTNRNDPDSNGWMMDIHTGDAVSRATGVDEPTGIEYDPVSNTLFISSDAGSGSFIEVVTGFDTPQEQRVQIAEDLGSGDTEDPAYDRVSGNLYFVDGGAATIFRLDPGVDGEFGTGDDLAPVDFDISGFNEGDWEALDWDPRTGNLLLGSRFGQEIYEITDTGSDLELVSTITLPTNVFPDLDISGLGVAPASFDANELSLWITDRSNNSVTEITFDGTIPPPTTTTTTQPTTTTTQATTTTTQPTTTTTQGTTTTTQASTTTTQATTTTTIPGSTTTTTVPGGGGGGGGNSNPFTDDDGSVFENSIEWLAAEGITQGCNPPQNTRFCPDDFVTRGQMAAFLVRAQGYKTIGSDYFIDDEGSVFENAINRLRTAGVTQGCNPPVNTRYCPGDFVTRGQMAAFLVRAFGYTSAGSGDYFIDDNTSVFEGAIDRLRVAGVTLGCNPPANNRYCPDDLVTRGQMAAFLKRALGG